MGHVHAAGQHSAARAAFFLFIFIFQTFSANLIDTLATGHKPAMECFSMRWTNGERLAGRATS